MVTSPPFALHFKKEYGNKNQTDYIPWFLEFAQEVKRVLTEDRDRSSILAEPTNQVAQQGRSITSNC